MTDETEIHDWGESMAAFNAWRAEHPLPDLGRDCRLEDAGQPVEGFHGSVGGVGSEVELVLDGGRDRGLFWNGRDY